VTTTDAATTATTKLPAATAPILEVNDLSGYFTSPQGPKPVLDGVSYQVERGVINAIVGETGSGKSLTSLSVLGLQHPSFVRTSGEIWFDGQDLLQLPAAELRRVRGGRISMVFQDARAALNPVFTVGSQLLDVCLLHHPGMRRSEAKERVEAALKRVYIPETGRRMRQYPHEFSGGMAQRVMIAMALLCEPDLVILDEPTTGLDVTIQAEIMQLIVELGHAGSLTTCLITHDLGIVAETCDHVVVMNGGRIVETGKTQELLTNPKHDYTKQLMAASRLEGKATMTNNQPTYPMLDVRELTKQFHVGRGRNLIALDHVDLTVSPGETLGLVGESGSGKSTLARCVVQLVGPAAGEVMLDGANLVGLGPVELARRYRDVQMVFQDPNSSLNPRMSVRQILAEPLKLHLKAGRRQRNERVTELIQLVGLSPTHLDRYPHELSGGQRQRIGIARAMAVEPKLVILDEPTSSLDVSVRGQILDLLMGLQERMNLAYLFISHDLHVVRSIAHRVAVMYLGEIVESGPTDTVFGAPVHPYTRALISAAPEPVWGLRKERVRLGGEIPSPINLGNHCRLVGRCPHAEAACRQSHPKLEPFAEAHLVRCPPALAQLLSATANS
jgi:peptide/nickel transport system ATP-binding protein